MDYTLFILVSFSILLYLLIIRNTLKLIEESHRRKNRPYLAIRKHAMKFRLNDINIEQPISELLSEGNLPKYYAECINLGRGPAINVSYSWYFNIDEFIKLITKHDKRRMFKIRYSPSHILIDIHYPRDIFPNQVEYQSISIYETDKGCFESIQPITASGSSTRIELSRIYITLVLVYLYLVWLNNGLITDEAVTKIPECFLSLNYLDHDGVGYFHEIF